MSSVFVHQPDCLADPGIDQRVDPSKSLAGTLIQRRAEHLDEQDVGEPVGEYGRSDSVPLISRSRMWSVE